MTIVIQLKELSFQIIPEKDLCFIWKSGFPIWSGCKDELIELLKSVHTTNP